MEEMGGERGHTPAEPPAAQEGRGLRGTGPPSGAPARSWSARLQRPRPPERLPPPAVPPRRPHAHHRPSVMANPSLSNNPSSQTIPLPHTLPLKLLLSGPQHRPLAAMAAGNAGRRGGLLHTERGTDRKCSAAGGYAAECRGGGMCSGGRSPASKPPSRAARRPSRPSCPLATYSCSAWLGSTCPARAHSDLPCCADLGAVCFTCPFRDHYGGPSCMTGATTDSDSTGADLLISHQDLCGALCGEIAGLQAGFRVCTGQVVSPAAGRGPSPTDGGAPAGWQRLGRGWLQGPLQGGHLIVPDGPVRRVPGRLPLHLPPPAHRHCHSQCMACSSIWGNRQSGAGHGH